MVVGRDINDLLKNDASYTALTSLWFLDIAALVHATRISMIHGSIRYTWQQTYQRCRRLASALAKRSISFGTTDDNWEGGFLFQRHSWWKGSTRGTLRLQHFPTCRGWALHEQMQCLHLCGKLVKNNRSQTEGFSSTKKYHLPVVSSPPSSATKKSNQS